MPYASDAQRAFMHAVHPGIARRWDAEEKHAPPVGPAMQFPVLRSRGLLGISDRVIADHLTLYERYCAELAAIDAQRAGPWRSPPSVAPAELHTLMETRVGSLQLAIEGELKEAIDQVEGELEDKGITWRPLWYIGDSDFWTADQANSINLPWFLANDELWQAVNENYLRYTREDVVRILRHETGHALGYAFEIWKFARWGAVFGDMHAPYRDDYSPDVTKDADFVSNIDRNGAAPLAHYAQKHPDEDWAETFAVWLDEGSRWQEEYSQRPGALAKLEAVQDMIVNQGVAYGPPVNRRPGRRVPYQRLNFTVAEFLGVRSTPDPAGGALRREPTVYDAVVLHELYFGGLSYAAGVVGPGPVFSTWAGAIGGLDAWAAGLREIANASSGWALTVFDRRDGRIRNVLVDGHDRGVPANCDVLIALDLFEHSYAADVGIRKDVYVAAWWRNIDWLTVDVRMVRAGMGPAPVLEQVPMPAAAAPLAANPIPVVAAGPLQLPAPPLPPPAAPPTKPTT